MLYFAQSRSFEAQNFNISKDVSHRTIHSFDFPFVNPLITQVQKFIDFMDQSPKVPALWLPRCYPAMEWCRKSVRGPGG